MKPPHKKHHHTHLPVGAKLVERGLAQLKLLDEGDRPLRGRLDLLRLLLLDLPLLRAVAVLLEAPDDDLGLGTALVRRRCPQ